MDNKKIEEHLDAISSRLDTMGTGDLNTKIAVEIAEIQTILKRILDHQQDFKNDIRRVYSKFDEVYDFVGNKVEKLENNDKANSQDLSKAMQKLYFSVAGGAVLFGINLLLIILRVIKP